MCSARKASSDCSQPQSYGSGLVTKLLAALEIIHADHDDVVPLGEYAGSAVPANAVPPSCEWESIRPGGRPHVGELRSLAGIAGYDGDLARPGASAATLGGKA